MLRRIEVDGALTRVGAAQNRLLAGLLANAKLGRMIEYEALAAAPNEVYTAAELLTDLRRGLFSELTNRSVAIDAFRRNLQRSYLDQVDRKLNPPTVPGGAAAAAAAVAPGDVPALLRGELRQLDADLRDSLPRAGDRTTRLHIEDARIRIARILDPQR